VPSGAAVGSRDLGPGLPAAGFVGRRPELARLAGALAGPPALVLVEGEAGIGKTRLRQEALAAPAMASRRVLVASCPPVR
jgi:predicted ATP-dependent serine protease